jgi:hypothetical protein
VAEFPALNGQCFLCSFTISNRYTEPSSHSTSVS